MNHAPAPPATALTLADCVPRINAWTEAARRVNRDVIVLCHGGPIAMLVGLDESAMGALAESCSQLLADQSTVAVGIVGSDIVVGDLPIPRSRETFGELTRRLKRLGIERIAFDRGVTADEITADKDRCALEQTGLEKGRKQGRVQ
mgnify:CR=1 FL=1